LRFLIHPKGETEHLLPPHSIAQVLTSSLEWTPRSYHRHLWVHLPAIARCHNDFSAQLYQLPKSMYAWLSSGVVDWWLSHLRPTRNKGSSEVRYQRVDWIAGRSNVKAIVSKEDNDRNKGSYSKLPWPG